MLKEVGASGQISLGKKFAGQLYDAVFHQDGRVELLPMKVVPATPQVRDDDGTNSARPARGATAAISGAENQKWAADHAAEIAQYNAWACAREPYSQRVRRWRQSQTDEQTDKPGKPTSST